MLTWTDRRPDRSWLADQRFPAIGFEDWRTRFVVPARATGAARSTVDNPAVGLFERYRRHPGVALTDVRLDCLEALRDLHGYALEPAWRAGCRLIVHADRTLDELDPESLRDPDFEYPWTLERACFLAGLMSRSPQPPGSPAAPCPGRALDAEQLRAVAAHDGAVQVIAPAGSGKTTVLIERVRELVRRGVPPCRILCATFNTAAKDELVDRLASAGIADIGARTFHSLGHLLLQEEGLLDGKLRQRTVAQWRRLAALAQKEVGEDGVWIEPPDARERISELKLGRLLTAGEWRRHAPGDPESRTLAALYGLYERELERDGHHDFDDLIFLAVRALRSDPELRGRWQGRFDRVLVDEYQDIEPAQEMLVQILAAPQDSLFVVGDPDQTLYGWRRASAARIVALDQTYPGLERCALATNYRCPPALVGCSSRLIAHNRIRFPQQIKPAPGRAVADGAVELRRERTSAAAARWVAGQLAASRRGELVALARTTRLLRAIAWACVEPPVPISAPAEVFESSGAQRVVRAHLQLAAHPDQAAPDDVLAVMRHPSRGLPLDAETTIAARLRDGAAWPEAVAGVPDQRRRIADAAELLDTIHAITDAARLVRALRTTGGLDRHFEEYDRAGGATEQVEVELLDDAERDATGSTVEQYADRLRQQHDALQAIRDDDHGVELTTIHRAKGREWPTVIVFGFDDEQLPHARALQVTAEQHAAGEGLEAERRIAYVALTRAKDRLRVVTTGGRISQFAWEAGMAPRPDPAPALPALPALDGRRGSAVPPPPRPWRSPPPPGDLAVQLGKITRIGATYAVRTAPDRQTGLRVAAWAIRHNLVTAANAAGETSARAYLEAIPAITGTLVERVLARAAVAGEHRVSGMAGRDRARLADVLDATATDHPTS